ncbi:MAG: sigma-70 family RNA polymerase sigma factor [Acidimicrobiia bacterium]|nr:sigma-70 family RNA polymerase sigma factor [Acidimicrobiia bacterium]MDH5422769.1 sigma-70 family RNA polymerase sigma factor [Acidimicrobiia bacterium]MDH5504378.1 sigma-70 family RNA polymerase sigma factor [Acidimicrobiia bacterium]
MDEWTDQQLVEAAQNGNVSAFEVLVRRHHAFLVASTLRIVRNRATAEDLAQEAMFRAWRKIGEFRGDAQFRSWVYRIATNLALNQVQRSRESTAEFPIEPTPARSAESVAIGATIGEAWAEAINTLPAELREPYRLREAEELSYQEIADQLDIPLNTVRTRIHRARGIMMERMQAWK